ncbi:MAG: hypothetical protein ACE37F_28755 [Nannocystaceae bacterium]|nr:hypothetical protein [bacterium]
MISLGDVFDTVPIFGNSISTPNEALFGPGLDLIATGMVSDAQIQSALP